MQDLLPIGVDFSGEIFLQSLFILNNSIPVRNFAPKFR